MLMHAVLSILGFEPEGHNKQEAALEALEYKPVLQFVQVITPWSSGGLNWPRGQSMQAVDPLLPWYLPALQLLHEALPAELPLEA